MEDHPTAAPGPCLSWAQALKRPAVWRRALPIGLIVGSLQIVINQGDRWFNQDVDGPLIVKTALTPLVALSVALLSAAATYADRIEDRKP